jgi:hypothetical protein
MAARRRKRLQSTGVKPNLFGTGGQPSALPFWQGEQQYGPPPGPPPPGTGGWYYQGQGNAGPPQQASGPVPSPPPQAYTKESAQGGGQAEQGQPPQYSAVSLFFLG